MGDVGDAIETVSGHLVTTHLHDNRGRSDDHLVPFDGAIDWAGGADGVQKVGYDGPVDVRARATRGSPTDVLRAGAQARAQRIEKLLVDGRSELTALDDDMMHVYIEDIAQARRPGRSPSRAGCTTAARAARFTS